MNKEGGLIIFNRFLKTLIFMTGLCLLPLKQSQQVDASPWVLPKERLVVSRLRKGYR